LTCDGHPHGWQQKADTHAWMPKAPSPWTQLVPGCWLKEI